jgi:hypothetical protein
VPTGRIGADKLGWRENWALISLEEVYRGENGLFWDMKGFHAIADNNQSISGDVFKVEDEGVEDLDIGRKWYKDGAMTRWPAGLVHWGAKVHQFRG